ncbi:hypothetical protein AVDCRST_MAG92-4409 [uncultured Coleofasciculus sp.]|uniref:Uncharacterized protein n=1 Tax=uncultured Coleofasciculus sp. TaxID=1267456 RepID=A0A6J4JZ26_9CYAN|nr:hypothetical protein AVDCRST_MAG92-4409 [uncultured Coleofasciculus sp.]
MGNGEVNTHHICTACGRQFIDSYNPPKGYGEDLKQNCSQAVRQRHGVSRY